MRNIGLTNLCLAMASRRVPAAAVLSSQRRSARLAGRKGSFVEQRAALDAKARHRNKRLGLPSVAGAAACKRPAQQVIGLEDAQISAEGDGGTVARESSEEEEQGISLCNIQANLGRTILF